MRLKRGEIMNPFVNARLLVLRAQARDNVPPDSLLGEISPESDGDENKEKVDEPEDGD